MNTSTTDTSPAVQGRHASGPAAEAVESGEIAPDLESLFGGKERMDEVFASLFGTEDDRKYGTEKLFLMDHGYPRSERIRAVKEAERLRAARLARPRRHIRDVFQDEARSFTPWVADNLGMVKRAVKGIDDLNGLSLVETEYAVGRSRIDVLARVERPGKRRSHVVIENQLTPSDASHLGRLVKYAQLVDAYAVIWICPSFTSEDLDTIDVLHRHMPTRFAAVRCVATQAEEPGKAYVDLLPAREDRPRRDIDDFMYDYLG